MNPVVRAARFSIAHVPHLVLSGSKPRRELAREREALLPRVLGALRSFEQAVAYPPHQVLIGNFHPEALREVPRPWHEHPQAGASAEGPGGSIVDEASFYAELAKADTNQLVVLETSFAASRKLAVRTLDAAALEKAVAERGAEPLYLPGMKLAGIVEAAHEEDESLAAPILLENLAGKVTGAIALRELLQRSNAAGFAPGFLPGFAADAKRSSAGSSSSSEAGPAPVDFLLGCGEEAVGDRYQRGGGNLAKAIGEAACLTTAGGADIKSFCASPVHAMIIAGALVASGLHRRVIVTGGGSLAKLGMKLRGHLDAGYPILEDVIVGVAVEITADDGISPIMPLDATATHRAASGSAPHQLATSLTAEPLKKLGLPLGSVDRFAVELHNPDITEPAGSGDVPANNYKIIAALAAKSGEIAREGMDTFSRARGLPGFSPTQGHIASAIPYLPHAIRGLTEGGLQRVQFIAKGSLFLGRMTGMGDGASFLLERNPARAHRKE